MSPGTANHNSRVIKQAESLRQKLTEFEQELARENSKPSGQQNTEQMRLLRTQIEHAQKEYENVRTSIRLSNPVAVYAASQVNVSPVTLAEVRELVDKDTTLLAYFLTFENVLAFVVTPDSFEAFELPVTEKDLTEAIAESRGFARRNGSPRPSLDQLYAWQVAPLTVVGASIGIFSLKRWLPDPRVHLFIEKDLTEPTTEFRDFTILDDFQQTLKQLDAKLIAPLRKHLKTKTVGIIPSEVLHYLSFAALTDGQRYFGEDYTLFYLPSASTLPLVQQMRKPGGSSVLVLAQSHAEGLPSLRYSELEAKEIAKLYNTTALVDAAATESAFQANAGKFDIVHLAAHAQFNKNSPLSSRIILAPDKDADGFLEVDEVYRVNLVKTDLVVLSACQTQLGAHSRGDDIIGLNRAFIYAGTPTVIASLWSVDDEATSVLMTSFYRHLTRGMSKSVALQTAQAETPAKYSHPYYWAAFILTGDPGTGLQQR